MSVIRLAISLVLSAGMSFRASGKVFVCLSLYLKIELGHPCHTTILNWTKKHGMGNFREKKDFSRRKWALLADESIQFGNKKMLFIVAVPITAANSGTYLQYSDLTPVVIKVSSTWNAEAIAESIKNAIDVKNIAYGVTDLGNNLVKAFKLLNITRIDDVNHKFSWAMQKLLENDKIFKIYTGHLSDMRAKLSMSQYARIVPPNQRIMSRYMNLTPLFEWGVKMLKLMETGHLTKKEKELLSFLPECKTFVEQIYKLLCCMNSIQKHLKTYSLCKATVKHSLQLINEQDCMYSGKIKEMIAEYFNTALNRMGKRKKVICSTDIVESCFGKYKELVKTNKAVGISDLALCLPALLANMDNLKNQFEKISIKKMKQWKEENIGQTLFGQKLELLKNLA